MTAPAKQLTNAELRQIIDSHEKAYGMCVPVNCDYLMARELLAVREAQSLRGIRVGNLPTMNQDEYPGLPDWWVQLRIGTDGDEVLARIYGSTPHEAMMRARAIAAPPAPAVSADVAAALDWIDDFIARCNGDDRGACNSVNVLRAAMLQPVSQGYTLPDVLKSLERLISVANTVNHAKQHEISIDDDPCYWQRQEWVEYLLEESKKAEEVYHSAMLVTGNSPVIPDGCGAMPTDYFSNLVNAARLAADKAMRIHPQPNYVLLKVAEEAGEVVQAGVHYAEGRMTWQDLEGEIVQLLAMLIRLVTEGDQVNGINPPASCSTATLAAVPDEIDIFVDQVCGNLPAGHQQ
ncbi:hypothetical protein RDT67_25275 [Serratia fonticola]|uniref:DUF551 domain-containing protein n=1 Tax=Serratia fonticola TaxID=47917 RepID=A0AAJ1YGE5_SERFO|nr:hypothetical protein [Serratia fonticola]MDQ9129733.1 hypothetical protein [Serratia fonticola]